MTRLSENRKETQFLMQRPDTVLSAKMPSKIGVLNVQTRFQSGERAQIVNESLYKLDILGITELRWTGSILKLIGTSKLGPAKKGR